MAQEFLPFSPDNYREVTECGEDLLTKITDSPINNGQK